jgi:hypothetical protein
MSDGKEWKFGALPNSDKDKAKLCVAERLRLNLDCIFTGRRCWDDVSVEMELFEKSGVDGVLLIRRRLVALYGKDD